MCEKIMRYKRFARGVHNDCATCAHAKLVFRDASEELYVCDAAEIDEHYDEDTECVRCLAHTARAEV